MSVGRSPFVVTTKIYIRHADARKIYTEAVDIGALLEAGEMRVPVTLDATPEIALEEAGVPGAHCPVEPDVDVSDTPQESENSGYVSEGELVIPKLVAEAVKPASLRVYHQVFVLPNNEQPTLCQYDCAFPRLGTAGP